MTIQIQVQINAHIGKTWEIYTNPADIRNWNFASEDWACNHAEIDLIPGGRFRYRMTAKDKSMAFDFTGHFTGIEKERLLTYKLDDDRQVQVHFASKSDSVTAVIVTFEPDNSLDEEFQKVGWQNILNNFKRYTEATNLDFIDKPFLRPE